MARIVTDAEIIGTYYALKKEGVAPSNNAVKARIGGGRERIQRLLGPLREQDKLAALKDAEGSGQADLLGNPAGDASASAGRPAEIEPEQQAAAGESVRESMCGFTVEALGPSPGDKQPDAMTPVPTQLKFTAPESSINALQVENSALKEKIKHLWHLLEEEKRAHAATHQRSLDIMTMAWR